MTLTGATAACLCALTIRQPGQRIHRQTVHPYLEMQVGAGGRPGRPDPADLVELPDSFPDAHADAAQVRVTGLEAAIVLDVDSVAVCARPAGEGYRAAQGGADGRSAHGDQVQTGMVTVAAD